MKGPLLQGLRGLKTRLRIQESFVTAHRFAPTSSTAISGWPWQGKFNSLNISTGWTITLDRKLDHFQWFEFNAFNTAAAQTRSVTRLRMVLAPVAMN